MNIFFKGRSSIRKRKLKFDCFNQSELCFLYIIPYIRIRLNLYQFEFFFIFSHIIHLKAFSEL